MAALLPLTTLLVLCHLNIPLGRPGAPGAVGTLTYPYSPIIAARLAAVPVAVLIAAVLALGIWLAGSETALRRRGGAALTLISVIALALWTFFAPPHCASQHVFNFQSPSQDGAFVFEALHEMKDVRSYLANFPQRARTPPQQMRGTRIISNPPLTTILVAGARDALEASPALRNAVESLLDEPLGTPALERWAMTPLLTAIILLCLWLLAALPLYGLARLFLPPVVALAFAACCFFSPLTALFSPGKDPAQLLTTAAPLWLWFWAYRRDSLTAAVLSGGVFVIACMASLIHVWIAAIVVAACCFHARRIPGAFSRLLWRNLLPAAAGALALALGLYAGLGWNVFTTAAAVARSQAEVTRGEIAMPFAWQILGIPLFLLFAGPAAGCAILRPVFTVNKVGEPARPWDDDARLGRNLLLGALVVMLATIGFTNMETPRLWIPFTPLLLLGAALQLPALRRPCRRTVLLLAALVFAQVTVSALQWSLMDMREAEMRLSTGRFFQ